MPNAIQLLRQDHKRVQGLFKKAEGGKGAAQKRAAEQVMLELDVHAQIEEEIFYPAVKKAIEETDLIDEALQEHQEAKQLIAQLRKAQGQAQGNGAGEEFEAKFSELVEAVTHHVEEEEGELFPKVEDTELDLADLGEQMVERKQELMQEMGQETKRTASRSRSKAKTKSKSGRQTKSRSTGARKSSGGKRARAR
jgi:hemerythrin superfamily protein